MPPPQPSRPVSANYPSEHLTIAAGTAIFHLASERVVVCYHTRDEYWFLPKGRRNANEETGRAAEREGFEESGFRNRLLPLPITHCQPDADTGHQPLVCEPIWTQLLPLSERSQYLLFWYVAETISPDLERLYESNGHNAVSPNGLKRVYRVPPPFSLMMTFRARIQEDLVRDGQGDDLRESVYEPIRHEGTGVDEEEQLYSAKLLPVEEACSKLRGSVMEDVVRRGHAAIQLRRRMEERLTPP